MSGSGIVDEDTARTINTGREAAGIALRTVQKKLQKVFIFFAVGLLGGIVAMRSWIWPVLKADLLARGADVIAQTPFDVILLQVKLGLIAGILLCVPPLAYFMREPLREREFIPDVQYARWKVVLFAITSTLLFVGGIVYAYYLFFPIMFSFLANNAMGAGFAPLYSIVHWTQFIMVLGFSFGLAAQLPLVMTAMSYTGIIPYETFRDKWKYAIVIMFGFGAMFSPPDPFTQMMWALPLVFLYAFSLYLSKIVVTAKRGSESTDLAGEIRGRWNRIAGVGFLAGAAVYVFFEAGGTLLVNEKLLPALPAAVRPGEFPPIEAAMGLPRDTAILVVAAAVALVVALLATLYVVYRTIEAAASAQAAERGMGQPAAIDLDGLDAAGVRAAPPEAFAELTEEAALMAAEAAMEDGDHEKARAILDRYDEDSEAAAEAAEGEAAEGEGEDAGEAADGEAAGEGAAATDGESADGEEPTEKPTAEIAARSGGPESDGQGAGAGEEESGNVFSRTSAGMLNAFTDDETTEDDVGGYYYDLAFIFDSLRSRMFRLAAVFMLVLAGVFAWLYQGGIGRIRADFISRIPPDIRPDPSMTNWPITLHPVEALVFEVKLSTVVAIFAIVPFLLYYAWPAMSERGIVTGDRKIIGVWGGAMLVGLIGGSAIGYSFIAPNIISWLVADSLDAGMIISYRVNNFFWLVFLTTVGIGLFANIPITMLLFHRGGIVSYYTMRKRWRVVAVGSFAVAGLVTPDSVYTMFIIAVPVCIAYGIGLFLLWVVTLGGRRGRPGPAVGESAEETAA